MKIIIPNSLEKHLIDLLDDLSSMFKWSWIKTETDDCMVILLHGQYTFTEDWKVVGEVTIRTCVHGGMIPYVDFIRHDKLRQCSVFFDSEERETFHFHVREKYLDIHWGRGRWYHFCENRVWRLGRRDIEENKNFAFRIGSDLGFDTSIFERDDIYWSDDQVEWYLDGNEGSIYEDEDNIRIWRGEFEEENMGYMN